MTNMTFGDLCRLNGGSYDFNAIETFDQHAKIYQYAEFHQNRTFSLMSPFHIPIMGPSVTSVGQGVGPTTLGPRRLLISMQSSINMPSFIKIAQAGHLP